MPVTDPDDPRQVGPARLIKLSTFLAAHDLEALAYLHLLLTDHVPSPVVLGSEIFIDCGDASSWIGGLRGHSLLRHAELIAKAEGGTGHAR